MFGCCCNCFCYDLTHSMLSICAIRGAFILYLYRLCVNRACFAFFYLQLLAIENRAWLNIYKFCASKLVFWPCHLCNPRNLFDEMKRENKCVQIESILCMNFITIRMILFKMNSAQWLLWLQYCNAQLSINCE